MPVHPLASAVLSGRALRLGPLRFTSYGLAAAAGLLAGMALSRSAARRTKLDPDSVWDAGMFAIFSCFVASRLLLILQSPKAFVHYPLLLLGLPSLTFGGMGLAAIFTFVYLRRRRAKLLHLLDTFAPPAALLAAFLELGHWFDGSEQGMPTRLPWGTPVGDGSEVRLQPVALYGVLLALALGVLLWSTLPTSGRSSVCYRPGRTAALGLVAGGLAAFGVDMLSSPPLLGTHSLLEPGQWIALTAIAAGALLWTFAPLPAVLQTS